MDIKEAYCPKCRRITLQKETVTAKEGELVDVRYCYICGKRQSKEWRKG